MNLIQLKQIIEARRTLKVLADPDAPWDAPSPSIRDQLKDLLESANQAPFHYPADPSHCVDPLTSVVPWRFHAVEGDTCRKLLRRLKAEDVQPGKIGNMLAAADALVIVTWLPDPQVPPADFQQFASTLRNMEHIAAASAATQNLLLLATAAGWNTYWSSGGILRSESVYRWIDIEESQILLGAVFLFPADTKSAAAKPGANRDRKGPASTWSRWVTLT